MGDLACGMHNSVSGMIKNALVRIKKKNVRKILAFCPYICMTVPLPVLQGYALFL